MAGDAAARRRVLIAGVGNILRGDDGFGVAVAQRLAARPALPDGVAVMETGIGGISLVQELLAGYDALIILDAVRRHGRPGTLYLLEPEVPDVDGLSEAARDGFLADIHLTEPGRALMLARALGVLPPRVYVVGCEPAQTEELAIGLSEAVERAVCSALRRVEQLATCLYDRRDGAVDTPSRAPRRPARGARVAHRSLASNDPDLSQVTTRSQ